MPFPSYDDPQFSGLVQTCKLLPSKHKQISIWHAICQYILETSKWSLTLIKV